MQIDTVTKIIERDSRVFVISLPRVRWLERDPDYRATGLVAETADEYEEPAPVALVKKPRPTQRSDALSPAQKQAWDLHRSGFSVNRVAVEMNRSRNAASKLLAQAREKLGIGLG